MICHGSKTISLIDLTDGPLICQKCDRMISIVDTKPLASWIEREVMRKKTLLDSGQLRTRIQTTGQNDQEIDRDGLHAEFATCIALCPNQIENLQAAASSNQKNRGRDIPTTWSGLPKPVEIKFTRYFSNNKGFLLIRPPSGGGSNMENQFIDDSIYMLLTKHNGTYKILGWVDKEEFLMKKEVDPVGRTGKQVECWGVLWKHLTGLSKLPIPNQTNRISF